MNSSAGKAEKSPVAYLVNQYPKGSHTFVRREILALETLGWSVKRFTVRRSGDALVDPADQAESEKTDVLLDAGAIGLGTALVRSLVRRPRRFWEAAKVAFKVSRQSERGLLYHGIYLAEACVLQHRLKAQGVRHLHAHFGTNSATVAMLASILSGIPYSFTVHGPEEFDKAPLLSLGTKVARAKFVAVISEFGRKTLSEYCEPIDREKIVVVPCGLDSAFLSHVPTPVPNEGGFVVVGRFCEQKGYGVLCDAMALLSEQKVPFTVTMIGDGELRPYIEAQIARSGLQGQVTLLGWQNSDGVRRALESARTLVLSSLGEGLPVVIMEALAMGRPVVTTDVAGIPELVKDGINGFMVKSGSAESLADGMKRALATDAATLSQMGLQGRARVLANHDVNRSATLLAEQFAR
jgi:colanic acid/amylovoran biosynthesis glycosyltransferase